MSWPVNWLYLWRDIICGVLSPQYRPWHFFGNLQSVDDSLYARNLFLRWYIKCLLEWPTLLWNQYPNLTWKYLKSANHDGTSFSFVRGKYDEMHALKTSRNDDYCYLVVMVKSKIGNGLLQCLRLSIPKQFVKCACALFNIVVSFMY